MPIAPTMFVILSLVTTSLAVAPCQEAPTPAPSAAATAAPVELTDKEKSALDRCKALPYYQLVQSSKCTQLMKKAGITPAKPEQPRQ